MNFANIVNFLISALKIIFLLGFLIFIHESGHFCVAKLCKVKVNEFSIGFGPIILKKKGKVTLYCLRLIPLGGFVSMEGEEEPSEDERAFNKASIWKRILIVLAGGTVNIIFALVLFWCLSAYFRGARGAFENVGIYLKMTWEGLVQLFTGKTGIDEMAGPVGISSAVAQTNSIADFIYILSVISLSIGVTNLLPFPPLDGGKIVLLIVEKIIRRPLNPKFEVILQSVGLVLLLALSAVVTYNDILKL